MKGLSLFIQKISRTVCLLRKKKEKFYLQLMMDCYPFMKTHGQYSRKKDTIYFIRKYKEVGAFNYMNWDQILELYNSDLVEIGNHSHSHEYLVDEKPEVIRSDILKSIKIFEDKTWKKLKVLFLPFWRI